MKFIDKDGNIHNTYWGALFAPVTGKMNNFMNTRLPGFKESANDFNDEPGYSMEDNGIYDTQDDADDMTILIKGRDDLFIPGTTPKVKCSKKHVIKIDYDNHQMILEDEFGGVLHTTNIDSRLMNCPAKDLINMVYDIIPEKEENTEEATENKD